MLQRRIIALMVLVEDRRAAGEEERQALSRDAKAQVRIFGAVADIGLVEPA